MKRMLNLASLLAAGVIGGLVSHYVAVVPVLAQSTVVAPKAIQAQSFALVDESDNIIGVFTASRGPMGSSRTVVLVDRNGREVWRASGAIPRPITGQR